MTVDPYGIKAPSANPDPLAPAPSGLSDSPGYATYDPLTGAPLSTPPPAPLPYSVAPYSVAPAAAPMPLPYTAPPPPMYPQAAPMPPVYGATYPPGAYPPPYPPPGYPVMYPGYPVAPLKPRRPGAATGSAVLAFVQSGLNIIGGFVLFSGGSALTSYDRYGYDTTYPLVSPQSLTFLGIGALVSGGLLIAGGATLLGRRTALLIIGTLLSLGLSAYIAVAISGVRYVGFALWAPLSYAVLPIISLCLLFGSDIRRWLRDR